MMYAGINERVYVNVKDRIEFQYKIKIKVLKEETDRKGRNGKYYIQSLTKPKLNFVAIKNYGNLNVDYDDRTAFRIYSIYIKFNDTRIHPYTSSSTTLEQAIENAKQMYNLYKN